VVTQVAKAVTILLFLFFIASVRKSVAGSRIHTLFQSKDFRNETAREGYKAGPGR
jgi:hypothetical protein